MDEYIKAVSTVGFPIALTIYLLVRFEKLMSSEMQAMRAEMQTLKDAIVKLTYVLARKGVHLDNE